jgi:hypothetical protein
MLTSQSQVNHCQETRNRPPLHQAHTNRATNAAQRTEISIVASVRQSERLRPHANDTHCIRPAPGLFLFDSTNREVSTAGWRNSADHASAVASARNVWPALKVVRGCACVHVVGGQCGETGPGRGGFLGWVGWLESSTIPAFSILVFRQVVRGAADGFMAVGWWAIYTFCGRWWRLGGGWQGLDGGW